MHELGQDRMCVYGMCVCVEPCGLAPCGGVNLRAAAMLGGGLGCYELTPVQPHRIPQNTTHHPKHTQRRKHFIIPDIKNIIPNTASKHVSSAHLNHENLQICSHWLIGSHAYCLFKSVQYYPVLKHHLSISFMSPLIIWDWKCGYQSPFRCKSLSVYMPLYSMTTIFHVSKKSLWKDNSSLDSHIFFQCILPSCVHRFNKPQIIDPSMWSKV